MIQIHVLTSILLLTCINLMAQTTDVVTDLTQPQGMALNGNEIYIAEGGANKISKIDITAASPTPTDVVTGLDTPRHLLLNGNDLYITELGKISKIDITAASPTLTDVVTGLNGPTGMQFNGNDLYIVEAAGNKISKIDITAASPTPTDVVTDLSGPISIQLNGNDLYIAEFYGNKISKIDITDAAPTATDVVTASIPNFITLDGNEIYIAEGGANKISKFDITNATPTTTDVVTGLDTPAGIIIKDNIIYISEYHQGKILSSQVTLSANENLFAKKIKMFPNPSSDFIQISGLGEDMNYKIFNVLGTQVRNGVITNNEQMDITELKNGMYLLKLDNRTTIKFIKE